MAPGHLEEQTRYWVRRGIITEEQRARMLADPHDEVSRPSPVFPIVATLGALFAGLGILIIIAANWDSLGRHTKLAIGVFSMLAFYAAGYFVRFEKELERTGNALMFLGVVLYGGTLFLIGQLYSFQSQFSIGFLLWFLGALPLAYLIESRLTAVLAVLSSIAFVQAYLIESAPGPTFAGPLGGFPRMHALLGTALAWMAIGLWHAKSRPVERFSSTYFLVGFLVWTPGALILSSRFGSEAFGPLAGARTLAAFAATCLALLVLPAVDALRRKATWEGVTASAFLAVSMALMFLPPLDKGSGQGAYSGRPVVTVAFVLTNAVLAGCLLGTIAMAHRERRKAVAYAASLVLGLAILVRYLELSMGYFSSQFGIVLLGAGILLLALAAALEYQRRRFKHA